MNHRIGSFTTTAPFDPADATDSASFSDSNVVAAALGTISLSGLDPDAPDATAFGVAFRSTGGSGGTLAVTGVARSPGFRAGQFEYLGLPG